MLHREEKGTGERLVLVHGAPAHGRHWQRLVDELDGLRVVSYDRRGHGRSGGRHTGIDDDVEDLAELIADRAHVVGGSFGGSVVLRLAAKRPDLFLSLAVHEPALPGLLGGGGGGGGPGGGGEPPDPKAFAESSLGEGAWERLTEDERAGFRDNEQAYRDEMADRDAFSLDPGTLAAYEGPALISLGGEGAPFFAQIAEALADALPQARVETVDGAGHLPHLSHPREYARLVRGFVSAAAAPR
jgi:pimeloyl-ACP methyl ester carboxylesterase